MRKFSLVLILMGLSGSLFAQVIPQPSPGANISQTVGITKINVEYSRPGVKGRKVFGDLVKFGKVWRTGANAATKISISNDITVNGMPLKAGKYAIMSIPESQSWTLIFSKELNINEENYTEDYDVLRVVSKVIPAEQTESFSIDFSDISEDKARMNFSWEKTRVSVDIAVNNRSALALEVESRNDEAAAVFQQGAEYLVNKDIDLNYALELIDKSILLKETFRNNWVKSRILEKTGKKEEALKLLIKAKDMGDLDPVYQFYKEIIEASIQKLSPKSK
ncbi:DUF2911 domain-containing protein [Emticicia sp. CRIBPO]|uniref:DUF2911 domain-containing protein n=1 Tax=Emticicia sp. CRIBPO TaxID=2683258 RepID=UPI0014130B83|nr:DUF2911 domain-containing protein [Emticicia sp. CRIBPO]NBA84145.1 DUF2911 domain-containing protein [Emticicia sp. CRIBPO]